MSMPIEEIEKCCKQRDTCCACPVCDECEELMDDVYNLPFGFVLEVFRKTRVNKLIRARLVFEQLLPCRLKFPV